MMNDFSHTTGELPSPPATFHSIYALQRTAPGVTLAAADRHATTAQPSPATTARSQRAALLSR
jgi:hypothetical protein